ncbi:MAG: M36 family metallopeptidase, partial [Ornithinibacter sp.]
MRKSRSSQVLAATTAAAAIAALAFTTDASAVTAPPSQGTQSSQGTETVDSRVGALVRPTQAQADAVSAIVKSSPGTRATWDGRFGTVRTLTPAIGHTLSGPRSGTAVDVARAWLTEHKAMLGLSAADITALQLRRDHVLPGTGTHVVQLTQTFGGLTAARGGSLGLAVQQDGSVLSYTGETLRTAGLTGSFKLSPAAALQEVAGKLAGALSFVATKTGTKAGYDVFAKGPFAASSYVKKVAFPTSDGARAAYSVLFIEKLDEAYQVVVDAETGKQLHKSSLVQHDTGGTVYDNYPGAPAGGQPRHVSFDANDASPNGYVDPTGLVGTGITTLGNNANAHANWSNFEVPADQGPRPVSPTGQFDYVFADHWGQSKCDPTSYPQDQEAATTNLFDQHNRIHDEYYRLG